MSTVFAVFGHPSVLCMALHICKDCIDVEL